MKSNQSHAPVVLSVRNVTKRFVLRHENSIKERVLFFRRSNASRTDFVALDNISIDLEAGHTIGLIGHNGSGKSTLLKIIGGIIDPSEGDVLRRGRLAALLELGAGFHPDLTGRENVFMNAAILGMSREETEAKFDEIVDFAGIHEFIDTQVKFYSSGMFVRLGFAVAIHTDPDILLVDEVLAVGDEAFQRKCLERITQFQKDGRTIVLVTHNLSQVVELCDRAILLDHGRKVFDGPAPVAVAEFRRLLDGVPEGSIGQGRGVTVSDAEVISSMPEEPHIVRMGSDFLVRVRLNRVVNVPNLICSIAIVDRFGSVVFGTQISRMSEDGEHPENVVEFTIKDARLAAGVYSLNVSIVNGDNHIHIEDLEKVVDFELSAPYVTQGSVFMESSGQFIN